ncbi:hypothetical protein [Pseudidiomarina homiensis]|uniref:Uncharacterized protein n=1 Tax=Pseudidiomarina homiensis TaxID=364198 RepID=A0A432Y2V7_9GAMM|nr:hypothetical protein [Pseudidiomarina homiensis]RUO55283.1 hypothetical protein CWI70_00375 [Pseudidiomarina homiensis]
MKATVALFALAFAATSSSALATTKTDLEAAIGMSLHAQAQQVKQQLDQQSREEQLRQLAKLRHAQSETAVIIADNRQVVKPQRLKAE